MQRSVAAQPGAVVAAALVVIMLTALAIVVPSAMIVTGPALAVGGVYLFRRSSDTPLRALGAISTALGVLMLAAVIALMAFGAGSSAPASQPGGEPTVSAAP